ncbi:MAG: hypothetical protein P4N60_22990 [Verrucomicrobiae bacterium]|nr:hypothetical protein [Verrucomicrobiae bacterium]
MDPERQSPGYGNTTKNITFVILGAYIALVVFFFLESIWSGKDSPEPNQKWYDLIKTGFTTLGSAFTLVLGYYFGNKQVQDFKQVKEEQRQNENKIKAEEVVKRQDLIQKLMEPVTEPATDNLTDAANEGNTLRQTGRPRK